jgi:hypothetical protein
MRPFIPRKLTLSSISEKFFFERMQNEYEELSEYLFKSQLKEVLTDSVASLILNRPEDPVSFLIEYLKKGSLDYLCPRERAKAHLVDL